MHLVVDMTVVGTGSITVTISALGETGTLYTLLAGLAIITNSVNVYKVFIGATVAANISANDFLPKQLRITITANNANPATYSVDANFLP